MYSIQTQAEFDLPVLCILSQEHLTGACLEGLGSKAAIGGVFTMVMCYVVHVTHDVIYPVFCTFI